jgi:serine/threonine-protein kinase
MDDPRVKPIEGTENGFQPFMSFDGEWLGFINEGKLKKIPLGGGSAQVIADLGSITAAGWAWGADGRILFGQVRGGLMQVPAAGGTPTPFTQLEGNELSHRGPHFLGDGRTIAFTIWKSDVDDPMIGFITPNGKVIRSSLHAGKLRDIGDGYVVFSNLQGTIFGATFDIKRLTVGTPVPLMSDVYVRQGGFAAWGASRNGSLIALLGEPAARLTLVDRSGAPQPLLPESRTFSRPRVSPDGSQIAVQVASGSAANTDIWLLERASQTLTRLTFGGGNSDPLWSRDGRRLLFSGRAEISNPENDLYVQPADGSSAAERILQRPGRQWAYGWLADGRVVIEELLRASFTRISAVRIGDTAVTPIVRAPPNATTRLPNVSPDGKWLAYTSNESGRTEVYATSVDGPSGKWQVSTQGGDQPLWSKSGSEIFYRDLNSVIAARVRTAPSFGVIGRTRLFEDVYYRSNAMNWDIMPDDRHFIMLKSAEEAAQLTVVTNWGAEIERRLRSVKR